MESCVVDSLVLDEVNKVVIINQVVISNPTFYNFLVVMNDEERKLFVERVMTIGFEVIQTQGQTNRVDFVKGEFDKMMAEFVTQFKDVFSESGEISELMKSYFGEKGDVTTLINGHFGKDGKIVTDIFNPTDSETPIGRFVTDLEALLDINNKNSAFFKIKECVETEIGEMKKQIEQRDVVAEAVAKVESKGTVKGKKFEIALFELVDVMARPFEDTVTFVGDEKGTGGKVGDILIQINPTNTKGIDKRIIIEAKKAKISMRGKKSLLKELDIAKENNLANYSIGAVHENHSPPSIGEFRRFSGSKIIAKIPEETYPLSLEIAYKVARAEIITEILADETTLDASDIIQKADEIKAELELMQATKGALTTSKNNIDIAYQNIEKMEKGIKEILNDLKETLETEVPE